MKFEILTEKEFERFSKTHPCANFFQTVENAHLRHFYGSEIHYLGVKEENKIIAAGMFTINPCMFGKKRFYSPQGLLVDYHNFELLKFFTDNLITYAKKHNAMFIKFEPNIIYQLRDTNGNVYHDLVKDDETINNLKKLGYHHFGFTNDYRFTQSRWNYRLELNKEYEELKKGFSKSTRKNIDSVYEKGLVLRRGGKNDLETLTELLKATADRKNFNSRDLTYYERMYDCYKDNMQIYFAHVDSNLYLDYANKQLTKEQNKKEEIMYKMKKDMVGAKLKNQLLNVEVSINRAKEELEYAKKFKEENPNGKDIGALLSLKSGNEYVTLSSGILAKYKNFKPKYLMYNEHILDAYKFGFKYVNFYGISGDFTPKSPIYGVYEFKRGFNGQVVELVGEFTYKISNTYYIYTALRKLKIIYRKVIKR